MVELFQMCDTTRSYFPNTKFCLIIRRWTYLAACQVFKKTFEKQFSGMQSGHETEDGWVKQNNGTWHYVTIRRVIDLIHLSSDNWSSTTRTSSIQLCHHHW